MKRQNYGDDECFALVVQATLNEVRKTFFTFEGAQGILLVNDYRPWYPISVL